MTRRRRFACVEAGGTKVLAAIIGDDRRIDARTRIATTTPAATLGALADWLTAQQAVFGPIAAAGIASFGPIALDRAAPDWGTIGATPKPHWAGANIVRPVAGALGCPVGLDTDVNGAALAELRWGAARGCAVAAYVTVGTGIGGGLVVDGRAVHGSAHPEMGHVPVRRHPLDGGFAGVCPFHGDCLEGLASGPAIERRWGRPLSALAADHVGHAIIADYLAQLVVMLQRLAAPQRIVIGGGVMATPGLLECIERGALALGGGYAALAPGVLASPALGDDAGLLGALALALDASAAETR
jgi:fructokinase